MTRATNTAKAEKTKGRKRKTTKDQPQLTTLNETAYQLLSLLLSPIHGTPAVTFSHILKVTSLSFNPGIHAMIMIERLSWMIDRFMIGWLNNWIIKWLDEWWWLDDLNYHIQELLPNMLHHYHGPLGSGPIGKHMLAVRADTVAFVLSSVSHALSQRDEDFLDPIHVFLQHICTRVADRAEYPLVCSFFFFFPSSLFRC